MKRILLFILLIEFCSACNDKTSTVTIKSSEKPYVEWAHWEFNQSNKLPSGWQYSQEQIPDWAKSLIPSDAEQSFLIFVGDSRNSRLLSDWQYRDLDLKITFALNQGASFALQLYDDYQLLLSNRHEADITGTLLQQDSIISQPYNRSNRKALVWQTVSIKAIADLQQKVVQVKDIYLNQNLIHQDVTLPLNNEQQWSINLVPVHGQFAVADVSFLTPELKEQNYTNEPVAIPNMTYRYYENTGDDWQELPDFSTLQPVKEGYIELFNTNAIRQRNQQYAIVFNGKLQMAEEGDLKIWLASDDGSELWINDKLMISHDGTHGPSEKSAELFLAAGSHPFELQYFQGTGGAALQLFYQVNGQDRKPLNSVINVRSQFFPDPAYTLVPGSEVYLQRGFVGYPQFLGDATRKKFTHTISVGHPEGIHYNYDLASGSLLQVWRGDFINVQTMWKNRGPEQTAVPLAEVVLPAAAYNWQFLGGKRKQWPDSLLNADDFQFSHYELDGNGLPVFQYRWKNSEVTDQLVPTESGLRRMISINSPASGLWFSLAKGADIHESEKGTYLVHEPGYVLKITAIHGLDLLLRTGNGQNELVASAGMFDLESSIDYEIIF